MRYLIIGAGPTGLGAAHALQEAGADWELYEAAGVPGGLSTSFEKDGFTWDIGGHILFSHYPEFDRRLAAILPPSAWLQHPRRAFIYLGQRWVPYPFQYNLRYLPAELQAACLDGLDRLQVGNARNTLPFRTFADLLHHTMGDGICRLFMTPYNTKVWAYPPERLSCGWIGERVALPDLARIRRAIAAQQDDVDWGPNASFRFPVIGGTGAIWQQLTHALPAARLHFGRPVIGIDCLRKQLALANGTAVAYDQLISTMPLDRLIAIAGLAHLTPSASHLLHTSTCVVGIGVAGAPPPTAADKCWIYFPEAEFPFYRVTVFSNYSPRNTPPGCYSLMAEISESPERPAPGTDLATPCVEGLRRAGLIPPGTTPVHLWQYRAEFGYPVPGLGRDEALARILPDLEQRSIFSRGRFGAWKYEAGNMDHSFMQGIEIARRLLTGAPETVVGTLPPAAPDPATSA